MVILVPVLLLFGLGPIQVAMWYHAHQVAMAAAETAAETQRVVHPTPGDAQSSARRIADQGGLKNTTVRVTESLTTVTVTVAGRSTAFLDLPLSNVSATVSMPKERLS